MNSRIEKYLDELKTAMADLDRSTIQDALANAEDHLSAALQAELAENPDTNAREVVERVIEQYGSPEDIRDVYSDIEEFTTPVFAENTAGSSNRGFKGFLGVVGEPRAWAACLYMILSFVTGTFYFTWAVTGFSLSMSLIVLIIGLPVTLLFFLSVRGLGFVEGRLVEALLGIRMPRRAIVPRAGSWWEKFKIMFTTGSTWKTLVYMILMLPIGVVYFTLIVTLFSLGLSLIGTPVIQYALHEPMIEPNIWIPFYAMPLIMALGGLLIILTLHLAKFVASVQGRFAKAMLVS